MLLPTCCSVLPDSVKRAIVNHGNFKLDHKFANYLVPKDEWHDMNATPPPPHINSSPKDSSLMMRSSQESKSVLLFSHGGKKPGQRKRKRAEKKTPHPRQNVQEQIDTTNFSVKFL